MGLIGIGILLLFGQPCSAGKIKPGIVPDTGKASPGPGFTGKAVVRKIPEMYEAVGTIRPRTETRISARLTAQIIDVKVRPGDRVAKGQVLVVMDDRQSRSRLDQARQGRAAAEAGRKEARQAVIAAEAAFKQAESQYNRVKTYFDSQAATRKDLEQAEAVFHQAKAGLQRSREALSGAAAGIRQAEELVKEAGIAMGYARIRASEDGEVLERLAEPGDMALPGKPLLSLRTAGSLRIEAFVREGLIQRAAPGTRLAVRITTLNQTVEGTVEEIVPYADPRTRTFQVKALLPEVPGLMPGMFGKLRIPVMDYDAVMIPAAAVRRVGQLELVRVREKGVWNAIYVQTGRTLDGEIEVLSGLSGGEVIGWGEPGYE